MKMRRVKGTAGLQGNATGLRGIRTPAGDGPTAPSLNPGPPPASSSPFANARQISNRDAFTILSNSLGRLVSPDDFLNRTILADNNYLETPPDFVLNAILTDPVLSPQSYHADIFDCDDYVQYLKTKMSLYAAANLLPAPLAVGYLLTTEHAFSFCIGPGSQLFLINTQSTGHDITSDLATFSSFLNLKPGNTINIIYL